MVSVLPMTHSGRLYITKILIKILIIIYSTQALSSEILTVQHLKQYKVPGSLTISILRKVEIIKLGVIYKVQILINWLIHVNISKTFTDMFKQYVLQMNDVHLKVHV